MSLSITAGYKVRLLRAKIPMMNKLTVRLFKNTPILGSFMVLTDFAEADFTGYVPWPIGRKNTGWKHAHFTPDGNAEMYLRSIEFTSLPGFTANDVWGWYMTDENGYVATAGYWPGGSIRFNPVLNTRAFAFTFKEGTMM